MNVCMCVLVLNDVRFHAYIGVCVFVRSGVRMYNLST